MKTLKKLALVAASLMVLSMSACISSQLYTRHQVSQYMNYLGMHKDEVLRRVCDIDGKFADEHEGDSLEGISPKPRIRITGEYSSSYFENYQELKESGLADEARTLGVHYRSCLFSPRAYHLELTFDKDNIVTHQEISWSIPL